ncbi:MAG: tRNA (adenine-N1)-methyltransferase [Bifidobacteriaceae bacterium]|nr:tRNA (adenine-N1)-methyltransferase [Bifidobacteriaceae bacterium]
MVVRRGPFVAGEKVQFTDRKGKKVTVQISAGGLTQTDHGLLRHDDVIGMTPGSVIVTVSALNPEKSHAKTIKNSRRIGGWEYTALRPRMIDYSLSMPRGAQVMYPKDIAQVISLGDIRRGDRVLESGGGSGAMTLALIDAVGETGEVRTIERRPEFARISAANIELYFGRRPEWWTIDVDGFDEGAARLADASYDRIVFDMLDPWNRLEQAERVIAPGGVLVAYVTTTTQLSRMCEGLRGSGRWTAPEVQETLERTWKVEGLAVRPDHQMIGHTGFLVIARAMAPGVHALERKRRATKDVYTDVDEIPQETREAEFEDLELRDISDRKVRKVLRDLTDQLKVLHDTDTRNGHGEGNKDSE